MGFFSDLLRGKPSTSSSGTQFTTAQKPFGPKLFEEADRNYEQGKTRGSYTGETLAGVNPLKQEAQNSAIQVGRSLPTAPSVSPTAQRIQENILGGDYRNLLNERFTPTSNAGMQGAINATLQPLRENFNENILPQIGSAAINQGAFGGSRQEEIEARAARDFNRTEQDIAAKYAYEDMARRDNLALQDLNARRGAAPAIYNLEQQGAGMLPGLQRDQTELALLPSQILSRVGEEQSLRNQAELDDAMKRFYSPQEYGNNLLNQFINQFSGISDAGKTNVSTGAVNSYAGGLKDLAQGIGGFLMR